MGSDCAREKISEEEKMQKPLPYFPEGRRGSAPRGSRNSQNRNGPKMQYTSAESKQRQTTGSQPSKMKYSAQLNQRQDRMLARQKHLIKEKEEGAQAIRVKLQRLKESDEVNEMKVLKLQRQLKVYEDLIAQHRKNIDKIEKAEEKIK